MAQVPSDGVLIAGHSLGIDESSMTGESKIVGFSSNLYEQEVPLCFALYLLGSIAFLRFTNMPKHPFYCLVAKSQMVAELCL